MYTLRFPFTLPPGREIAVTDCFREVDGLSYRFAKQDRVYVLTLSGFPTAGAAEAHLRDIRAGFIWMLLQTGIAANAVFDPQKVTYAGDPMLAAANLSRSFNMQIDGPIDALLDGQRPAVYPSEKRIKVLTGCISSASMISFRRTIGDISEDSHSSSGKSYVCARLRKGSRAHCAAAIP
jgi:hypothetical protein